MIVLFESQTNIYFKFITLLQRSLTPYKNYTFRDYVVIQIDNIVDTLIENYILDNNLTILENQEPYLFSNRDLFKKRDFKVSDIEFNDNNFVVISGPCTVENRETLSKISQFIKDQNLSFLRGGAYKPRKSPYTFQGLGSDGIHMLKQCGKKHNLSIVTELLDIRMISEALKYSDIIQVGARNMHNYPLLKELGKIDKPILLKRGLSATIDEFLLAADYILSSGNDRVILCERGIRTFEKRYKSTLDLGAVAILKKLTHLPIIVDPSHAMGDRDFVIPMALAAIAAGADGLLIEIHSEPNCAICDGEQSLTLPQFETLIKKLRKLAPLFDKNIV